MRASLTAMAPARAQTPATREPRADGGAATGAQGELGGGLAGSALHGFQRPALQLLGLLVPGATGWRADPHRR